MKGEIGVVIVAIILLVLCFAIVPVQTKAAASNEDYGALIKNSCVACHGLKKVCSQVGKADGKEWKAIINRMAKKAVKKNITLTDDQQTGMIKYLSTLKDSKTLCTD
jgi:mono/diheme cytochrome c family protein